MMEMILTINGNFEERWQKNSWQKIRMGYLTFCNFFVAQRSLFYFQASAASRSCDLTDCSIQFANILDFAKDMIHEVGLPMLLKQIEKESPPFWKGPPSKQTIDGVVDAVGNLTGKT
jgi:hypothetical protein